MATDELKRRSRIAPLPDDLEARDESEAVPDRLALTHALGELTPEQQLVVHLRLVEGLPFAEVAPVLGRSVGACQMLLLRAGRALQAALQAEGVRSG